MKRVICFAFIAAGLNAQAPNPQLSAPEFNQLCARVAQLMDAGGVAVPDLRRAAEPVIDNVKQACSQLQLRPATGQPSYALLMNLRAFLDLADAVPKPFPFPDIARDQLREVRDAATRLDAHFRALLDQKDADLRSPDRDGALRFSEENRLVPPPKASNRRVVFLGDSITNLWRLNEYFPDDDFLNRGINAQLTGQLLTRMKADVVDLKPAAVVIQGGTFDLTRNVSLPLIAGNIQLIADIAAANNIKVVIASVLPVNDYHKDENPTNVRTQSRPPAQIVALNDWLKTFAAQRKFAYIDFYNPLVDTQGFLAADASDDGLHPNAKGYRLMAPVLARALDQTLKPPPPPAPVKTKPTAKK
jgi:lysophospholipase L1-like esterase